MSTIGLSKVISKYLEIQTLSICHNFLKVKYLLLKYKATRFFTYVLCKGWF